jgi:hypothetical protein
MKIQELENWVIHDGKLQTPWGLHYIQCNKKIEVCKSLFGYVFGYNYAEITFDLLNKKPENPFTDDDGFYHIPGWSDRQMNDTLSYHFWLSWSWERNLKAFRLFCVNSENFPTVVRD